MDGSAWTTSCTETRDHVVRGGSWDTHPIGLRAANRYGYTIDKPAHYLGFRLGRTLTP